ARHAGHRQFAGRHLRGNASGRRSFHGRIPGHVRQQRYRPQPARQLRGVLTMRIQPILRARVLTVVALLALIAVSTAVAGSGSSSLPPRVPWAVPTIPTGFNPSLEAVNESTHTLYVYNGPDSAHQISVVDSRRCNAENASHCQAIATLNVQG